MKSPLLSAMLLLMLLPLSAHGQYCSPVERSGFTGGAVSLLTNQNLSNTLQAGINYWTNACTDTGAVPSFSVNDYSADLIIPVNWHGSEGPRCGQTTWTTFPVAGAQEKPVSIDLYAYARNADGVLVSCEPIQDALAHEIGHVLGLGDAPSPDLLCRGDIMGGRSSGETKVVTSSDCATADSNWYTPIEQQRDQQLADDQQRLQECESRCSSHCEMAYGGSYYCPTEGQSPIIFDFDDDGFNLTDADHGVDFDLNADRQRERIAWTSSAGSDAWLCRDRNGNGVIDDGSELFGNFTPLANGRRAPNGFVALAEFDAPASGGDGDGKLDSSDRLWTTLRLWIDANHDGISQPGELITLAEAGVQSIDLHYIRSSYTDDNGNIFRFRAKAVVRDAKGKFHNAKIYDVFLSTISAGQP